MSKQCEVDYFRAIGVEGQRHAMGKPFSDDLCPSNLVQLGAIMQLLPPPPARILDIGCGTGWTSLFLGRRGYDVTGVDISGDMVQAAEFLRCEEGLENVQFREADYESLPFDAEFDAALFYDSLHHAVEEVQAVQCAHRALSAGGVCITSEPGRGHSAEPHTQAAVARFGITEKDMPPNRIITAGRKVGFRSFRVFPHASTLVQVAYHKRDASAEWASPRRFLSAHRLARFVKLISRTGVKSEGIVFMMK